MRADRPEDSSTHRCWSAITRRVGLVVAVAVSLSAVAGASQWETETVDLVGNGLGRYPLAFDPSDGNPSIAYHDFDSTQVKFAHLTILPTGPSWVIQYIDDGGTGPASGGIDLTYDVAGFPALAYRSTGAVKFAQFDGTTWDIEIVADGPGIGDVSLAFDNAGHPAISYYRIKKGRNAAGLVSARWNGSGWDVQLVDEVYAYYNSQAFDPTADPDCYPAIAYWAQTQVRFACWNGSSWDWEIVETGYRAGDKVSLDYDPAGNPAIVHLLWDPPADPKVHYRAKNGSSWGPVEVVSEAGSADMCSLAFDGSGTAWASYVLDYDFVMVARREVDELQDLKQWVNEVADSSTELSFEPLRVSLAHDPDGLPAVTYRIANLNELKFARKQPQQSCTTDTDCDGGICCGGTCTTPVCTADADCDDGDSCTGDSCSDPGSCTAACVSTLLIDCDDANACTVDSCVGLSCEYSTVSCDDGDDCTIDTCDPDTGCVHDPDPACSCAGPGVSCTDDADCCSGKCKGKPGSKTCN